MTQLLHPGATMASRLSYAAPPTVQEAVAILAGASGAAKVLAGGTDLKDRPHTDPSRHSRR
jgi:CO/xanthine dehydrogenase FAD-binding subunit